MWRMLRGAQSVFFVHAIVNTYAHARGKPPRVRRELPGAENTWPETAVKVSNTRSGAR